LDKRHETAGGRRGCAPRRRIGWFLAGWALLAAVSCTGTLEEVRIPQGGAETSDEQGGVSFREAEFRFAMAKLENGDFEGARETLSEIAVQEGDQQVEPEVIFALGVLKLLEMEDVDRMRKCKNYFQAFADQHPGGPYRENAERIVHVLNSHLRRAQKQQKRIKQLTLQVSEQEKTIQTLQYKIDKLEEIHRETEQKRHLLDGE
jgi:hypothetical protein